MEVEPLPLHLDPRQRHLVGLAAELVQHQVDWRDLLIVLAAMVPADQQPEELLAWVVAGRPDCAGSAPDGAGV